MGSLHSLRATLFLVQGVFWFAMLTTPGAAESKSHSLGQPTAIAPEDDTVPAVVPRDYVVTPSGYFHRSCVQQIETDEIVNSDGTVRGASGRIRRLPDCAYPHYVYRNSPFARPDNADKGKESVAITSSIYNGWIISVDFLVTDSNPAHDLYGNTIVPPNPSLMSNQTIGLFPGLIDQGFPNGTILQPVVSWNGFNDHAWSASAWNCCMNGVLLHSPPVSVSPGDDIYWQVYPTSCMPTPIINCTWNINMFRNGTSGTQLWFTPNYGQVFDWIFGAALETYGITSCQQFPPTPAVFTSIFVSLANTPRFGISNPPWGASGFTSNAPPCGYGASWSHPSAPTLTDITLTY